MHICKSLVISRSISALISRIINRQRYNIITHSGKFVQPLHFVAQ